MILATGGLGFIGAYTARGLIDLGAEVVATQYRVARNPAIIADAVSKQLFVEQLDVTDRGAFLALGKKYPSTASFTSRGQGHAARPLRGRESNNAGLLNALLAPRDWEARVSVASSVAM